MTLFWLSALRAVVEMLALCLLGQGVLALLAGSRRSDNAVYRFLSLVTHPPRRLVACCLPAGTPPWLIGGLTWGALVAIWIGIAAYRLFA